MRWWRRRRGIVIGTALEDARAGERVRIQLDDEPEDFDSRRGMPGMPMPTSNDPSPKTPPARRHST